ncbi:hypothetical protein SCHPADRAFT_898583 [Schizopora paradoxa]|uniref:VWFA domain-containing protein n=1 Tax=Schizopora paradoxa TaxID=27342 RepID=A0A0H2SD07_9AGAM|nr:hypothetical protein SCHPADRAFT_898583 [Schizopora paradoxa]
MTFSSTPAENGTYRIKIYDQDLYLESIPTSETSASTSWMRLAAPNATSDKQKWILTKSGSLWTIQSADNAGLKYKKTSQTYRGHGFPYPEGTSLRWSITEYEGLYSKFSNPQNGTDCFDSQYRAQGDDAVHFWAKGSSRSSAPYQCFVFEPVAEEPQNKLDIVFIQDSTGSQQMYINAARTQIKQIIKDVQDKGGYKDGSVRFSLIAFRDHPPQDRSFVTKVYPFTSDVNIMESHLQDLIASGGGDGPEAQADGLFDAYNAAWDDDATKMVILITDSPPHGVEPSADGFPGGCPCTHDPLRTAAMMKDADISLRVIACEPTLTNEYSQALAFYYALVRAAGGDESDLVPLGNADSKIVQAAVTGLVSRACVDARLTSEYKGKIQQQFARNMSTDAITTEVYNDLAAHHTTQYTIKNTASYEISDEVRRNIDIWAGASSVAEGKRKIMEAQRAGVTAKFVSEGMPKVSVEEAPINKADVSRIISKALRKVPGKSQ